ncbi:hypothetical protein K439DRAFT_1614581 [Ramaria rubella]|nr:hypothetical protein K439DRAFT_1614581 [Ramaria rubella]
MNGDALSSTRRGEREAIVRESSLCMSSDVSCPDLCGDEIASWPVVLQPGCEYKDTTTYKQEYHFESRLGDKHASSNGYIGEPGTCPEKYRLLGLDSGADCRLVTGHVGDERSVLLLLTPFPTFSIRPGLDRLVPFVLKSLPDLQVEIQPHLFEKLDLTSDLPFSIASTWLRDDLYSHNGRARLVCGGTLKLEGS